MEVKQSIPWWMAAGRAMAGPVLMAGAKSGWSGVTLAGLVVSALLSDILDGVLARRWKCDTAGVRLFDSLADTFFYLCVAGGIWVARPEVWASYRMPFLVLAACEAVRFGFDFGKFGKPASYHSYLAKTWGLVLAAAVVGVFVTQRAGWLLTASVALGVASNLETLAMSVILPAWRRDVKTLAAAWRLRGELLREGGQMRKPVGAVVGVSMVLCVGLLGSSARAQSLEHVTYVGGTVLPANGVQGKVNVSSPDALVFEGPSKLVIAYDHVISYESRVRRKVHVGLLTEGVWRLLAPWPEGKQISVSYRDAEDHKQVVLLEMSRADEAMLVEVLKTRVPRGEVRPVLVPAPGVRTSVVEVPAEH